MPGYYRDYDSWLYLSSAGELYHVADDGSLFPGWAGEPLPLVRG